MSRSKLIFLLSLPAVIGIVVAVAAVFRHVQTPTLYASKLDGSIWQSTNPVGLRNARYSMKDSAVEMVRHLRDRKKVEALLGKPEHEWANTDAQIHMAQMQPEATESQRNHTALVLGYEVGSSLGMDGNHHYYLMVLLDRNGRVVTAGNGAD